MRLRTVIVDDEPLGRELLRVLLQPEEIQIVAECKNGREAIDYLHAEPVDLLFLDVQMPNGALMSCNESACSTFRQ